MNQARPSTPLIAASSVGADPNPPLPEVLETHMNADELRIYFGDLEQFAKVQDIFVKSHARSFSEMEKLTLEQTSARLLRADLRSVQIRYIFEGEEWRDTILVLPNRSFRIVRMTTPLRASPVMMSPSSPR